MILGCIQHGVTALCTAAEGNHVSLMELLLDKGAIAPRLNYVSCSTQHFIYRLYDTVFAVLPGRKKRSVLGI